MTFADSFMYLPQGKVSFVRPEIFQEGQRVRPLVQLALIKDISGGLVSKLLSFFCIMRKNSIFEVCNQWVNLAGFMADLHYKLRFFHTWTFQNFEEDFLG